MTNVNRKLSTILAADCAGFSKFMDKNEELTLETLKRCRSIIDPIIAKYSGRIFYTAGDSVMAEFQSPLNAVNAAIDFQSNIHDENNSIQNGIKLIWRVGIHLDDVIIEGDNIYGTGVNIAARLESSCKPGQILISSMVKEQISNKIKFVIHDAGKKSLKNISTAYQTFGISPAGDEVEKTKADQETSKNYKPKLAIMPFSNINDDNEGSYLVDGIVEDLITEFSMIKELKIVSRQSCFDFKSSGDDIKEFCKKFAVDYIVTGNIRSAGKRVRISVELSEPSNSNIIWNNKYDKVLEDIFEVQDEIVRNISISILGEIEVSSLERARRKPTDSLTSYELLLKGKVLHHEFKKDACLEAITTFDKAIEADENNGQAYAWKACAIGQALVRGFIKGDFDEHWKIAEGCLEKARRLDNNDFEVHRLLAEVKLSQENFLAAEKHAKTCYKLVPNDPRVLSVYGEVLVRVGKVDEGLTALEKAYELNPVASGKTNEDHRLSAILFANYMARNLEECTNTINKLENIDFRSWLLTSKLCSDENYEFKNKSWFKKGKVQYNNLQKYADEIVRFKLNNKSNTKALVEFLNNLI